jgi:hypothetical protein
MSRACVLDDAPEYHYDRLILTSTTLVMFDQWFSTVASQTNETTVHISAGNLFILLTRLAHYCAHYCTFCTVASDKNTYGATL